MHHLPVARRAARRPPRRVLVGSSRPFAELEAVAATARGEAAFEAEATKSAKTATTRLSDAQTRLEAEAAVLRRDHSRTLVEKRALERQLRRLQEQTDKERANLQKVRWYWAEW